ESDELDVVFSFKQLFTLLPGYPGGNTSTASASDDSVWGPGNQVTLHVTAKRDGSGAESMLLPRVLNFTGSQLFEVDYESSLEPPSDEGDDVTEAATGLTLDIVLDRRRYGSVMPWNPARPSDACDACLQQLAQIPRVADCLGPHFPESAFQGIFEATADKLMPWDTGKWAVGDTGAPANVSLSMNDMVDTCFGLHWLLNGFKTDNSSTSEWPTIDNLQDALVLTRAADASLQCFVDSQCPVTNRNFAQAAGRVLILEHDRAMLRVDMTTASYAFYLVLMMGESKIVTPVLSSSDSPERLAELIANSVLNASHYQLAVDVRHFNNSEDIRFRNGYNDWLASYYRSGGNASKIADAASSFISASDSSGSNVQSNSWPDTPMDIPEMLFTVEISFRNVSVVPDVLGVLGVREAADGSMTEDESANLSWQASRSDLRIQLAPLNLSAYQYVPPPTDINLSWDAIGDTSFMDMKDPGT
ncbi:hypothetical protein BBJ28_00014887, partial [Nothophytophthora sp. Chile5]